MNLTEEDCNLAFHALYEVANNCDVSYVGSKNSKCNREFHILDDLIEKYFELIEENIRLENQFIECQRVCKNKQERIEELQFNPPLTLKELDIDDVVWDKGIGEWIQINAIYQTTADDYFIYFWRFGCGEEYKARFEENRFYRKQVEE